MRICNLLTGGLVCLAAMVAPLTHAAQLVIGQVAPLSGLNAGQARAYSTGLQLYLNQVNKAGGVNGNTFVLVSKDDSGRSEDTVSAARPCLRAMPKTLSRPDFFFPQTPSPLRENRSCHNTGESGLRRAADCY